MGFMWIVSNCVFPQDLLGEASQLGPGEGLGQTTISDISPGAHHGLHLAPEGAQVFLRHSRDP